jgi:hypothetical protein
MSLSVFLLGRTKKEVVNLNFQSFKLFNVMGRRASAQSLASTPNFGRSRTKKARPPDSPMGPLSAQLC